jgi:hypothetical protein
MWDAVQSEPVDGLPVTISCGVAATDPGESFDFHALSLAPTPSSTRPSTAGGAASGSTARRRTLWRPERGSIQFVAVAIR